MSLNAYEMFRGSVRGTPDDPNEETEMTDSESTAAKSTAPKMRLVTDDEPAKEPKRKAEKTEEGTPLPVFDTPVEALTALTKATQAEESARDRRKQVGVRFADGVKQARTTFDLAVSEAPACEAKAAAVKAAKAEEYAKEVRAKAKALREEADDLCTKDKGRIGKSFAALSEVKDERAEKKSKAAKAYRRAEEKRGLIVEGIVALAKQLRLSL